MEDVAPPQPVLTDEAPDEQAGLGELSWLVSLHRFDRLEPLHRVDCQHVFHRLDRQLTFDRLDRFVLLCRFSRQCLFDRLPWLLRLDRLCPLGRLDPLGAGVAEAGFALRPKVLWSSLEADATLSGLPTAIPNRCLVSSSSTVWFLHERGERPRRRFGRSRMW